MKKKILIISANYYQNISNNLQKGIEKILLSKTNRKKYYIKKLNVPGVFELPVVISKNIKNMILVTRSKKKVVGLDGYGIKITKQEIIK